MKLSIKTRSKFLKAQFVVFMTRRRYVGSYPKLKRFILSNFLVLVIGFVGWNISLQVPEISVKWDNGPIVIEQRAEAKFTPKEEVVEVKEFTIEEKIAKTFPENPELMIAVFKAESGLDPLAFHKNTNGSHDIGIAQINSIHGGDDLEMFDVDKNLKKAREIYDKQGISAWYGFTQGGYAKFMK